MACYRVLLCQLSQQERIWLRFEDGRPVSAITVLRQKAPPFEGWG